MIGPDPFFNEETKALYNEQGLFKGLNLPKTWREACKPTKENYKELLELNFNHLISAHGDVLRNHAKLNLEQKINEIFPVK